MGAIFGFGDNLTMETPAALGLRPTPPCVASSTTGANLAKRSQNIRTLAPRRSPVRGFDEAYIGIADAHSAIKGFADNERLKSQFLINRSPTQNPPSQFPVTHPASAIPA
jgi:hypothetical protein